jgi:hypothetical protein
VAGPRSATDSIAISVHGPQGVLDLLVPAGATAWDVAREYATRAGSQSIPLIYTRGGATLGPDEVLADLGLESGDLLVASPSAIREDMSSVRRTGRTPRKAAEEPSSAGALIAAAAALAAILAGMLGAYEGATWSSTVIRALLVAVVVGVAPVGRFQSPRALAAPAFAGAAVFAVLWDPAPERLPALVGATALTAAAVAAVARALAPRADEGLRVWIIAGCAVFALGAGVTLLGWSPPLAWSLLTILAMLAARFVPVLVVDVPDQYLLDFDRLAVTAWTARSRPKARRGQLVVPERFITRVATRAARLTEAAALAIMVCVPLGALLLLRVVPHNMDRIGARVLAVMAGLSLLLVARSYRHVRARLFLRLGGLITLAALVLDLAPELSVGNLTLLFGMCVVGALIMVVAAVATGRGWRSVSWSRRAELAESLSGAAAVAAVFVSSGAFRAVLEWTSSNAPS